MVFVCVTSDEEGVGESISCNYDASATRMTGEAYNFTLTSQPARIIEFTHAPTHRMNHRLQVLQAWDEPIA